MVKYLFLICAIAFGSYAQVPPVLLLGPGAGVYTISAPSISLVQSAKGPAIGTYPTSLTLPFTSNTGAGNGILVVCATYNANTCAITSNTQGLTFNAVSGSPFSAAGVTTNTYAWIGCGTSAAAESISLSWSNNTAWNGATIFEFTGTGCTVDQVPIPVVNTATTAKTSGATGITTAANEILFGIFGREFASGGGNQTLTQGSGWIIQQAQNDLYGWLVVETKVVSSTGAYTAIATGSVADTSQGFIITIK